MKNFLIAVLAVLLLPLYVNAEEIKKETGNENDGQVYSIDIDVVDTKETGDVITKEDMELKDAHDLWDAVRYTPGIILSGGGSRNDSSFTVRGFGSDSVPVFVDGVTMTDPYKGHMDAGRILTGDLENVVIQKGYSSMLLGANTLGGAVLMKTAKPRKEFEARIDSSFEFDSIYKHASDYYMASVGSRQDFYYVKGTVQYRDVDHFRLSDDFEPTPKNPQGKGERLFSGSDDTKVTLIGGVTPSDDLDIWATYIYQESDKGVSPPETSIPDYFIWDWTKWQRQSISLASSYDNGRFNFDTLIYYDKYDNSLNEYHSITSYNYGVHSPTSEYDEYSFGGKISAGLILNSRNNIQAAATFKRDKHKGLEKNKKIIDIEEDTFSVGAEYTFRPLSKITVVGGVGYDTLQPRDFWSKSDDFSELIGEDYYVIKTDNEWLVKGQLGLFYEFIKKHELRLTYARKNHFPNMSQRYSTRYGAELPNPSLQPEIADHYEFGYKGSFEKFTVNTDVYYSILKDKIVTIEVPNPSETSVPVDFALNIDEVTFYGFEFSGEMFLSRYLSGGAAFALNKYDMNKSNGENIDEIGDYPSVTASGYLVVSPTGKLSIIPRVEFIDSRYADSEGDDELDSYTLASIKAVYDINKNFSVSGTVANILDENYEIRENYPMAGRTFSVTLSAKF